MNVDTIKKFMWAAALLLLGSTVAVEPVRAQFTDYEQLARQNDSPPIFLDVITLPGDQQGSVKMTSIFRVGYPFLAFKKSDKPASGSFVSMVGLNMEVFESPRNNLRPDKQVDVEELTSIGRASWQDTAYAATYEQTQSKDESLSGSMQVEVKPGFYSYLLQLKINDEASARNSRTQNVHINSYNEQTNGEVLLIKSVDDGTDPSSLELLNMGGNVPYGKDFYALVHIPNYDSEASYTFKVGRVDREEVRDFRRTRRVSSSDTGILGDSEDSDNNRPDVINAMTEEEITAEQIITGVKPTLVKTNGDLTLKMAPSDPGHAYALVKVPNKSYPNAFYEFQVTAEAQNRPVARRFFQSYWPDIPTSLLSLDVAIEMLRFIADKETVKRINNGSDREREQKFRDFWAEKDPTPDTEYNELQAEYYRRIDYTYEEFSSERQLGYESDRGNVYIRYGPPSDIKRTFPVNAPTTEVWTYPSRTFIFRATTGFGDFELVSN